MNPLIIAHRGACYFAPENTVPAFKKAVEIGVDGIETDVQLTYDGKLVIHHNYSIIGTTGIDGKIADMTQDELKSYDFGSHKGPEFSGTAIATLDECLEAAAPLKYINLELKAPVDRSIPFVSKVIDAVKAHNLTEKTVLSGFDHSLLRQAKELCPDIRVGALTMPAVTGLEDNLFGIPFDIFPKDKPLSEITEADFNMQQHRLPELGSVDVVAKTKTAVVMELVLGVSAMFPGLTMPEALKRLQEMNDLVSYVKGLDFKLDYLHPHYSSVLRDKTLVPRLAELGIGVSPYTPDDPKELDYLYHDSGCFGIISNRPDILLSMAKQQT